MNFPRCKQLKKCNKRKKNSPPRTWSVFAILWIAFISLLTLSLFSLCLSIFGCICFSYYIFIFLQIFLWHLDFYKKKKKSIRYTTQFSVCFDCRKSMYKFRESLLRYIGSLDMIFSDCFLTEKIIILLYAHTVCHQNYSRLFCVSIYY